MAKIDLNDCVQLHIEKNIANIIVNNPPVSTIDADVREGLNKAVDEIEKNSELAAVLLMCTGTTFFSGADINEFNGPPKEAEYHKLFLRIENLSIPVIAAMHGTVMGGGLEIALACHFRIAEPGTRFALPEVTLGIIPGAGGTQRMPRLIGIEKTLELVINARPIPANDALKLGFIDDIIKSPCAENAQHYVNTLLAQKTKPRPTSLNEVAPLAQEKLDEFTRMARRLYPHQTAPLTAIEAVNASSTLPFKKGLEYETERVNQAKETPESKALIHLFFANRNTTKIPSIPETTSERAINHVAVIGAGTMGGGIAMCFANAGIPVTLIDVNQSGLDRGLANIDALYESRVKRGRITPEDKQNSIKMISGKLSLKDVNKADLIIEAVFEDIDLKKSIFAELDKHAKAGAILGTNTSTLDINDIAKITSRPEDVIGLHFFSPANVMPLLEVVTSDFTSDEVVKTAMSMAKPIRKTPVLARVCYGFIGNRMMEGYGREAELMALEGASPAKVDAALKEFGMAMGILAVFDMAGVDVGVNVHKANAHQFPPDPNYYQASQALFDADRLGQKNGKGFYHYKPGDRKPYEDDDALTILRERAESLGIAQRNDHSVEEIIERCIYPLLNEAIAIIDEGIAIKSSDVDVVWSMGYGFPRFRGGPLFYADTLGLQTLYNGILKYQQKFGSMHWRPARLLEQLVSEGKTLAEWEADRSQ